MKQPAPRDDWPADWHTLYRYDLMEVFGDDSDRTLTGMFKLRFNTTMALVERRLPVGSTILDVGAAQGNFTLSLAERGYRLIWNDIIGDREGYVREKYEEGEVAYAPGNIEQLHLGDLVDAVVMTEIIEHVAHPDHFLATVATLVKPGGWIFLSTPNGKYFRNKLPRFSDWHHFTELEQRQFQPDGDGHIFALWPDEVHRIAERAGLQVRDFMFSGSPLLAGSRPLRRLRDALPLSISLFLDRLTCKIPWVQSHLHFHFVTAMQKAPS